jgi:hypothetical protein
VQLSFWTGRGAAGLTRAAGFIPPNAPPFWFHDTCHPVPFDAELSKFGFLERRVGWYSIYSSTACPNELTYAIRQAKEAIEPRSSGL